MVGRRGDDDAQEPGGRAAERLREFEAARGLTSDVPSPTAAARPNAPRPEGGKALARLRLFERARGLDTGDANIHAGGDADTQAGGRAGATGAAAGSAPVAATYAASAVALTEAGTAAGATTNAWRWLGPTTIPNGQTYGTARVDVVGRVAAIAVDPHNSAHLLVGAAGGGVWESVDTGATWAARSDGAPTLTTGAVVFDPASPSTVYVGTGEGNWYSRWGAGVLRSSDGGTTFTLLVDAPFVGQGFFDLVIDPTDSSRLLAATSGGVYRSTNGGVFWTQIIATTCWDLSIAKRGTTVEVLAACADGLHRSTDVGATFSNVVLPGAPTTWDRLAVSHAPSQPAVAHVWGASGSTAYLYRRSTNSGPWTKQKVPANDTGQAWYDWFCATAPDNPNRVYLGAVHAYRGERSGRTWTWENISSRATGDSIHPDQHAIAFDPASPDVIYIGNDGGLFRSADRGTTWTSLNHGLGITEVEYLAQHFATTNFLLAGTQDNGTMRYTGSPVWEHAADGDGGDCGVNRDDPTRVYHSFYGMGMERSTTGGGWGSYSWIGPNVPQGYNALFYPPLEVCGSTVAMAGQSVFVSRDQGTTFVEVALPGDVATAMHAPNRDRIYVGTAGGSVYRLDWNGVAWTVTTLTMARPSWVSDINVDPSNGNRVWLTSTTIGVARVFRSDDGAATWTDVTSNLPYLPMNSIEIDPTDGNRAWVAADLGVYETLDAGATWSPVSKGLPNSLVTDLVFHRPARLLRAGTRNRGVWELLVN